MNCLQINRPSVYFFLKIHGVKGKLFRTYFGEMGSFFFFGFCNTIFCRHLQWISKKFFHEEIQELLNFQRNVTKKRPSVSFHKYYWYQRTTQWVKLYIIGEFFFSSDFVMFFCIHRVIYLADFSAGFITKKIQKFTFFFENKIYYCLEIT